MSCQLSKSSTVKRRNKSAPLTGHVVNSRRVPVQEVSSLGTIWTLAVIGLVFASSMVNAADEKIVYVENINVIPPVKEDGSMLSTVMCSELSKSANHSAVCEQDMQQLMDFAALKALTGNGSEQIGVIENTLDKVDFLITGKLRNGKFGYILYVEVSERNPNFTGTIVVPGHILGRYKVKGIKRDPKSVLEALGRLGPRVTTLISPVHHSGEPPAAAPRAQ